MTNTSTQAAGTACGKRWPLYASLAANCFLIGVLAQPLLGGGPVPMDPGMPPPPRMEAQAGGPVGMMVYRIMQALPQDDAAKARAIFDEGRVNMQQRRDVGREAFAKVAVIMRQDQPDLVAIDGILDSLKDEGEAIHQDMKKTIRRLASELSPESRRKIADLIEQGPHGFGKGGPRGGRGARGFDGAPMGARPMPPMMEGPAPMDDAPPQDPAQP